MRVIIRYILSAIFFSSAITKLIDFTDTAIYFASTIAVPLYVFKFLLTVTIGVEFLVSMGLITNLYRKLYFYYTTMIIIIMFLLFSIVLTFEKKDNCGCYGTLITISPLYAVIKNSLLLGALSVLRIWPNSHFFIISNIIRKC